MILTEEEAKTKTCPLTFGRVSKPFSDSWAGGGTSGWTEGPSNCIASACMAWRWLKISQHGTGAALDKDAQPVWNDDTPRGYCGLAGAP